MGRNTGPRYGELCTVQCTLYIYVQVEEHGGILDRDMGNYVLEDTRLSTLQKKLTKERSILSFSFCGSYQPFKIKRFFSHKKLIKPTFSPLRGL